MKKKIYEKVEVTKYFCDICDLELNNQSQECLTVVHNPTRADRKVVFMLHHNCLIEHLKQTFIPQEY